MTFSEFKKNIQVAHPRARGESNDQYEFWLNGALEYFRGDSDFQKAWDKIKLYDGHIKRPRWEFFKSVAGIASFKGVKGGRYYRCNNCKAELSESSQGGCPHCHSTDCDSFYSLKPVNVTICQSACFNCELYSASVMCATCADYGTPAYRSCKFHDKCPGRTCCKYEFLRKHDPHYLKKHHEKAVKALPKRIKE